MVFIDYLDVRAVEQEIWQASCPGPRPHRSHHPPCGEIEKCRYRKRYTKLPPGTLPPHSEANARADAIQTVHTRHRLQHNPIDYG